MRNKNRQQFQLIKKTGKAPEKNSARFTLPGLVLDDHVIFPMQTLTITPFKDLVRISQGKPQENMRFAVLVPETNSQKKSTDYLDLGVEIMVAGLVRLQDGQIGVVLKGIRRIHIESIETDENGHLSATVTKAKENKQKGPEYAASLRLLKEHLQKILKYNSSFPQEILAEIEGENLFQIGDILVPFLSINSEEKQKLLFELDGMKRIQQLLKYTAKEVEMLKISSEIHDEVKGDLQENFRKNYLKEQLMAIKRELGADDGEMDEIDLLQEELEKCNLPKAVRKACDSELDRLGSMPPGTSEYMLSFNYLSCIKDLPWNAPTENRGKTIALSYAKRILNQNHYGLETIKEQILEYLAVVQHKKNPHGQILLLVGPPGVGKTSLAKSIAQALRRPFQKVSLGGVRDEAEIRGHRRTYIGAMPGKILQAFKEAKASDPVVLLDEMDKVGLATGVTGDVSSALLEVLDPEQNSDFVDHYLVLPFDLSKATFIATANSLSTIPAPLLDRMEIIELSSYTEQEKLHIAQNHLLPQVRKDLDLPVSSLNVSQAFLKTAIRHYTREAGVRQLKRELTRLGRKVVKAIVTKKNKESLVVKNMVQLLGMPKYLPEPQDKLLKPGVSIGLAYTSVGGDILYIEARKTKNKSGQSSLLLTGQLGKVMQESAQSALTFLQSKASDLGLDEEMLNSSQVHLHFPDGATPKDGPSAGVAILACLYSLFTNKKMNSSFAMTGEITLRGQVLPVGGIKEKLLAAHRYGKRNIIIPWTNWFDLEEVPKDVLQELTLYPVKEMSEALTVLGLIESKQAMKPKLYKKNKDDLHKILQIASK